jgi:hypothetical protein
MEYAACNVVYVDRTAGYDRWVSRGEVELADQDHSPSQMPDRVTHRDQQPIDHNLRTLLETFSEGWLRALTCPVLSCPIHVCMHIYIYIYIFVAPGSRHS